jgi:hypothetical protein
VLNGQLRSNIAGVVLDRKLRERLLQIAAGEAPPLPAGEAEDAAPQADAEPEPAPTEENEAAVPLPEAVAEERASS